LREARKRIQGIIESDYSKISQQRDILRKNKMSLRNEEHTSNN
jgi:hypothetical protein